MNKKIKSAVISIAVIAVLLLAILIGVKNGTLDKLTKEMPTLATSQTETEKSAENESEKNESSSNSARVRNSRKRDIVNIGQEFELIDWDIRYGYDENNRDTYIVFNVTVKSVDISRECDFDIKRIDYGLTNKKDSMDDNNNFISDYYYVTVKLNVNKDINDHDVPPDGEISMFQTMWYIGKVDSNGTLQRISNSGAVGSDVPDKHGNVYFEKFTNNPLQWLKKNRNAEYSLNQMFNYDLIKNDKVIWKRGNNGTLRDVLKNINKRDIQYTQQVTTIKRGQNGGLFNQQLVGKDENASMPVKKGRDVNIYGGYKSITPAFFTLIESEDKKGNKQRSIESVPLFMKNQFLNDSNSCMEYFENVYGLKNPKVVISQIRKNTYLIIDDFPVLLRGSTGKQLILQCAAQLMVSQEQERYLKKLEKYIQKNSQRKDKKQNVPVTEYDGLTQESNIRIYDTFIDKLTNTIYSKRPANPVDKLKNKREIFEQLSVECQCIVLNEILHLFQCKPIMGADLSMLGEAKATGIITKNKIISTCNNVIIVNQSVTGLFKQETDLLNI